MTNDFKFGLQMIDFEYSWGLLLNRYENNLEIGWSGNPDIPHANIISFFP